MSKELSLDNLTDDGEIEAEDVANADGEHHTTRPYDPRLIRVEPKMFSLRNIMDMIEEKEVDLAPDFQRLRVWSARQKSRLIESVLLRIPLPAFYFASDDEGKLQVVDGVQRLSTIYEFVRGDKGFPLVHLEYLTKEVGGKSMSQLRDSIWAKRINSTQIVANVIDAQTPVQVKFDIFKRINTGGTPLNSQEIRHCMSGTTSRQLLRGLTETHEFASATDNSVSNHVRMADREMALRVVAFSILGQDVFLKSEGLDDFLNKATQYIDSMFKLEDINMTKNRFTRAMIVAREIFGDGAFRKWPLNGTNRFPINRAIFEAVGFVLFTTDKSDLKEYANIQENYRKLCTEDYEFISSVTQSTGSARNVLGRFAKIREAFVK